MTGWHPDDRRKGSTAKRARRDVAAGARGLSCTACDSMKHVAPVGQQPPPRAPQGLTALVPRLPMKRMETGTPRAAVFTGGCEAGRGAATGRHRTPTPESRAVIAGKPRSSFCSPSWAHTLSGQAEGSSPQPLRTWRRPHISPACPHRCPQPPGFWRLSGPHHQGR